MRRTKNRDIIAKQRHCGFCIHGVKAIDYKDSEVYRRYLSGGCSEDLDIALASQDCGFGVSADKKA